MARVYSRVSAGRGRYIIKQHPVTITMGVVGSFRWSPVRGYSRLYRIFIAENSHKRGVSRREDALREAERERESLDFLERTQEINILRRTE